MRAVKIVRKEDLEFGERKKLLDGIEILKEMDHPNICRIVEMFEDRKRFYFVSEYLSGQELFDGIVQMNSFSESDAAAVFRQLLSAISYIHSKGVVHRDIKPENIRFETNTNKTIKLMDSGTSKRVEQGQEI